MANPANAPVVVEPNPVRVKLCIRSEPSMVAGDAGRTTVTHLLWIQPLDDGDNERYAFPDEVKNINLHARLFNNVGSCAEAKKDMSPRWTMKIFRATIPSDLVLTYFDADGNPKYNGVVLPVYDDRDLVPRPARASSPAPVSVATPAPRAFSSIIKDIVITKFNPKNNINPEAWISTFEGECARLEISIERYWEALRMFLEESAELWYTNTRLTSNTTAWDIWRNSFVDSFGERGIASIRSAVNFRYISGSLSEYCQKKLSLLLLFNPKMHEFTKIGLITLGLPQAYQDRINLAEVDSIGKLFSQINTFEKQSSRTFSGKLSSNSNSNSNSSSTSNAFSSLKPRQACQYCKKKGFDGRMHHEKDCFNKWRDSQRNNDSQRKNSGPSNVNSPSKSINSLSIDEMQSEIAEQQKNE